MENWTKPGLRGQKTEKSELLSRQAAHNCGPNQRAGSGKSEKPTEALQCKEQSWGAETDREGEHTDLSSVHNPQRHSGQAKGAERTYKPHNIEGRLVS